MINGDGNVDGDTCTSLNNTNSFSVEFLQIFVVNARSVCNKIDELRAYAFECHRS